MITSNNRSNPDYLALQDAWRRSFYSAESKRYSENPGEREGAEEARDAALYDLSSALPAEVKRVAENSGTGIELAAELLMLVYPSLQTTEEEWLTIDDTEPFSSLGQRTVHEQIPVHIGRLLDDLGNSFDRLVNDAKVDKSADNVVADARAVIKHPDSWPTVWKLIHAIRS